MSESDELPKRIPDGEQEEPSEPLVSELVPNQPLPPPEELEPEEGAFDVREYLSSGLNLDHYLEPLGFTKRSVREGVTVYTLRHVPLEKPVQFYGESGTDYDVTWANVHVRYDSKAAIPFWRVLVSPGHEDSYFVSLQMAKIVRLDPDTVANMEWVPDAVAVAKQAIEIVQQPCRGHLALLTHRLKKAGFKPLNSGAPKT